MIDNIVDAISSSSGVGPVASSTALSHTCDGRVNKIVVASHVETDTAASGWVVTGITYGGVALTKITGRTTTSSTDTESVELWELNNPPTGANNLVANYTSNIDSWAIGIISLATIDTSQGSDSSNTGVGTTSPSTISTTVVRPWAIVIAAMNGSGSTTALTSVANQTVGYKVTNTGHFRCAMDYKILSGGGSASIGWTFTNEAWVTCICSISLTLPPEFYNSRRVNLRTI